MVTEHPIGDDMSDDRWLHALRTDVSPVFKGQLRERLRGQEPAPAGSAWDGWRRYALIGAAAVIVVAILSSVPAVRASVVQFASLFRIINVVGVPIASNHLDRLNAENLQIDALIGEHLQVIEDPGVPVSVPSLADAAAAAGMTPETPQWLPDNTQVMETAVVGERAVRVTFDSQRLQQVMDALGIDDLTVPAGLDGQVVDVRVPPVVMIRYDHQNGRRTRLFQARTPQVTLPDSIDLPALGEIGLRILGLPAAEAKQFAAAIDWHTTLIVPVPPNATSFQQVDINGHPGVLIQNQPGNQSPTTTIVWSTPDRVFALVSIQGVADAMAMAISVR
jgi:hypothetical protein